MRAYDTGLPVYVTGDPTANTVIIVATDIYGFEGGQVRQVCDDLAARTKAQVSHVITTNWGHAGTAKFVTFSAGSFIVLYATCCNRIEFFETSTGADLTMPCPKHAHFTPPHPTPPQGLPSGFLSWQPVHTPD